MNVDGDESRAVHLPSFVVSCKGPSKQAILVLFQVYITAVKCMRYVCALCKALDICSCYMYMLCIHIHELHSHINTLCSHIYTI